MKKLLLLVLLAGCFPGCASRGGYAPMGYLVDCELYDCAFRYHFSPYYDASARPPERIEIVRVERSRIPRVVGARGVDTIRQDGGWYSSTCSAGVVDQTRTVVAVSGSQGQPTVVAPRGPD